MDAAEKIVKTLKDIGASLRDIESLSPKDQLFVSLYLEKCGYVITEKVLEVNPELYNKENCDILQMQTDALLKAVMELRK